MERYILLQNARIADTQTSTLRDSDILIRRSDGESGSEIVALGEDITPPSGKNVMLRTLNLFGRIVCPSFTDMRCDICEPGSRNRESFETLGEAAAYGGFGALLSVPISGIDADEETVISYILQNEKRAGRIKIYPSAPALLRDRSPCDPSRLRDCGACAIGESGAASTSEMLAIMRSCAENDILLVTHCEDRSISDGDMHLGHISSMLGYKGIPYAAEEIAVARNLLLAAETSCRLHISHVSTKRSLDMIRNAKKSGVNVTCDTAVQYFTLTDSDVFYYSANAKVEPPLRTSDDVAAVIEALKDGTIDCICSDHAPRTYAEKPSDFTKALPGIIGLQSAFTVALSSLVMESHITIFDLIRLFCDNPASILGHFFKIEVGAPAYLNVISLEHDTFFQVQNIKSKSKNSPYLETSFRGCLTHTVIDGILNTNPDISEF
ncbi:MAG: amidohydrolase family protein [Clostridia bacterium]|nr:amidohydrolase family protein [Clostridia bacterium]